MKIFKKSALILMTALLFATLAVFLYGCQAEVFTISFETFGGAKIESLSVEQSKEYQLPTPQRDGFVFDGWYKTSDFSGGTVSGKQTATENVTYYAKWTQTFTLTLDAAGGELSVRTFALKQGEDVYAKVKDLVPTYAHHEFVGWYMGGRAIAASTTMPAENVTLTANYNVGYVIEVYLQKEQGSSEFVRGEDVTGYEKAGKNFVAEKDIEGYKRVDHENAREEGRIDENYLNNVFKLYFEVEVLRVVYYSDYPQDTALPAEVVTENHVFGDKIKAPFDYFSADGYVFVGWAERSTGEVRYKVDYLMEMAVNADGDEAVRDEITVDKNLTLFAVWKKGYYNLFGGEDVVYYPDEGASNIYLERGGLYFIGSYLARFNSFDFTDKSGNVMLEGKFLDAYGNDVTASTLSTCAAFAIRNDARDTDSYNLYKVGSGINNRIQIIFDEYNGITYSERGKSPSEGIYYIDEQGRYVVSYSSGPLDGTDMVIMTNDAEDVRTFRVRNEVEFAYGEMPRGVVVDGELRFYNLDYAYGLKMDGFGNAVYNNAGVMMSLSYSETENEGEYELLQNDAPIGVIRVFEDRSGLYYMFYGADFEHEYKISETSSIALDGVRTLTFIDGENTVTAYYSLGQSAFGDVVRFYLDGEQQIYLISAVAGSGELGGDQTQTETTYVAKKKADNYAEFFFKDGSNIYYGPMLVLNGTDGDAAIAEVWMRTSSGNFAMVSKGRVTDGANGRKTYTETEKFPAEDAATKPVDFSTVKAFTFGLGAVSRGGAYYNVNYWYDYTDNENKTKDCTLVYTDGNKTLTVILPLGADGSDLLLSDAGIYFDGANTFEGVYTVAQDGSIALRCVVSVPSDYGFTNKDEYFYFRTRGEELIVLDAPPHKTALRKSDGTFEEFYLYFDGESGKASLVQNLTDETVEGTFVKTGTTAADGYDGLDVYTFTAEGVAPIRFVVVYHSASAFSINYPSYTVMYPAGSDVAYVFDQRFDGEFASENATLRLDGFGAMAIYYAESQTFVGSYVVTGDKSASMSVGGKTIVFDFDLGEKTFTERGAEYGVYRLTENNFAKNVYFELDGYGGLKVYALSGSDKAYIAESGSYTFDIESGAVVFDYVAAPAETFAEGVLIGGNGGAFIPFDKNAGGTYINGKNWSVLVLDAAGRALTFDENGFRGEGKVTFINDTMLYFADDNGVDGKVFNYNRQARTISAFTATQRAYYTHDFKSLVFMKNGFVVSGGEMIGYFAVSGSGVVIYRQTGEGEYGFTADTSFGTFENENDYGGVHYYRSSGTSMTFTRDGSAAENYRLPLNGELNAIGGINFAPPGTETFKNVLGQVEINSRNYDCLITRTDTEMFMTVGLSDGSSYKVYLATDYRGSEQSTYSVTGVERTHYIYSSQYLTNYFMYYYYYGAAAAQSYANNYGTIEIVDKYDEAGEVVESYAEGKFGTAAQYFDSKGNPLTFKAAYELREKINPDTDLYIVAFDGEDGFKYKAYFIVGNHPYMNRPAYIMTYFGREETVTADGGEYEVTVERIVASDVNNPRGALSDFSIRKSGTPVTGGAAALVNGVLYYIVRTDEGATYYFIDVRYESAGEIGEGDDLLEIVGAKVTVKTAVTYEQKDGDGYVDFVDGKLTILSVNTSDGKKNYIVLDYEYDEATSTYTVTIGETVYTVRIEDGKAVITSNAPPKEDEEKPKQ